MSRHGPRKLRFPKIQGDSDRQSLGMGEESVESRRTRKGVTDQERWLGESGLRSDSTGTYSAHTLWEL